MAETNITMDVFFEGVTELLGTLKEKEKDNLLKAAEICAESIANDGVIHVFGSGHSVGFGMEMAGRPGSFVPIHPIKTNDFVLKKEVTFEEFHQPYFERTPGIAYKLYDLYDVHPQDCFIIISNSGINGVVIDLAATAKERGHKVIVVTSWQHTSVEDSRHPSGKKLYMFGDVVIDNCGPRGDALLETGDIEKVCSVSSITGAFIAQSIEIGAAEILIREGKELPVLKDPREDGAKEYNEKLLKHYEGRI